jgi:threonyl-tRNA synthetase
MTDAQGWRIYRSSATFLLSMAIEKLYDGKMFFSVEHSLGTGFFCRFGNDETCLTSSEIGRIEDCMRELAEKKLPIQPVKIPF